MDLHSQLEAMSIDDEKKETPTMKEEFDLYDYQKTVIEWMKTKEAKKVDGISGGLVCLTMGLGKTLTGLYHIVRSQIDNNEEYPTLVVMSKTLLYEWRNQGVHKFFNGLTALYFHHEFIGRNGCRKMTTTQLKTYHIVFTTYDMCLTIYKKYKYEDVICEKGTEGIHEGKIILTKLRTTPGIKETNGLKSLYEMPWSRIICDESQRFANPKTVTWRAMMAIYATHRWCLTGTPIRNYETDIWAQLRFCGFDKIVHPRHWKRRCFSEYNCADHLYILDYTKAGVNMPLKSDHIHQIEMDHQQERVYKTVLKKLENIFSSYLSQKAVSYIYVLAMFTRLRQVCIAPHLLVSKTTSKEMTKMIDTIKNDQTIGKWLSNPKTTAGIGAPKIQKVVEIVKSVPNEKVIVFSMFTSALELVKGALDKEDIPCLVMVGSSTIKERLEAMQLFKETPRCNVMLIHYKVGGEGINLTEATHVIPLEPWWTHAVHNQGIHRAWRRGQTKPVKVHWLLVKDSIEKHVLTLCKNKQDMSDAYMGYGDNVSENSGLSSFQMRMILGKQ